MTPSQQIRVLFLGTGITATAQSGKPTLRKQVTRVFDMCRWFRLRVQRLCAGTRAVIMNERHSLSSIPAQGDR